MDHASDSPATGVTDAPAVNAQTAAVAGVSNGAGTAAAVLVCEHASRYIPATFKGLGLDDSARASHAAWDIGALSVAEALATGLDAPLVASRISRLVYDCNRPPEAPDAIPAQSERFVIPGNRNLSAAARAKRAKDVLEPFSALLEKTLAAQGRRVMAPPALITIHSFTPTYHDTVRTTDIGILHDTDTRLADAMLATATRHTTLRVDRNAPYGPQDGVTYTLQRHGIANALPNVMIEIRNDLLGSAGACADMAAMLTDWLHEALRHSGEIEIRQNASGK